MTRPNRKMYESGDEQTVVRTEQDGRRIEMVQRQVGWIGQSGDFYSLTEDPSKTEPGSFSPLWFCAHEGRELFAEESLDVGRVQAALENFLEHADYDTHKLLKYGEDIVDVDQYPEYAAKFVAKYNES